MLAVLYLIGNQIDTNAPKRDVFLCWQTLFMTFRCLVIYACLMNICDAIWKK